MTYHDDDYPPGRLSSKPREKSLIPGGYAGTYQDSSTSRPTENEAAAAMVYGNLIAATDTHAKMLTDGYAWCKGHGVGHWVLTTGFGVDTRMTSGYRTYCKECEAKRRRDERATMRQRFTNRRKKA